MTYRQCEAWVKQQLQTIYPAGEAASITHWVLDHFTKTDNHNRRLLLSNEVDGHELRRMEEAITALLQHKPVQYVLGYAPFYGLRFWVNEAVLIPRPETEELVAWMIAAYKQQPEEFKILDIGTGSGCIPVALKKHLPKAVVSAVDVSREALQVALKNAADNAVPVTFQQLDFLDENAWQPLGIYHVIVSNPPYIPAGEKRTMDENVTAWEPATALFVPDENPLLFYQKIALFGKTHLYNGGAVFMETHKDFAKAVQQLFQQEGYSATLQKDMHGNERMVMAVNREASIMNEEGHESSIVNRE